MRRAWCWGLVLIGVVAANASAGDPKVIENTPGLVAFWTFGEPGGSPRRSVGTTETLPLLEVGGPIERAEGGPFSGSSAYFNGRQYFHITYADLGKLNISGPDAQVSMVAFVRLRRDSLDRGLSIAGVWCEGEGANDDSGTRQYALLANMPAYGGRRQLTPHISSEGGVTRRADGSPLPWCADYAATRAEVPVEVWCSLGMTYDGKYIRAYINGVCEERALDPKTDRRDDPYFTKEGPNGGDRGMNPYYHGRGIFGYDPAQHAKSKPKGGSDFTVAARYAEGTIHRDDFHGEMGGLAVFNRALSDAEMAAIHASAQLERLPR